MRPLRILTLAFLLFTLTAAAQTDRRIEEQKRVIAALEKRIATEEQEISKIQKGRTATEERVRRLARQIDSRNQLLDETEKQARLLRGEIARTDSVAGNLSAKLERDRAQYGEMVREAYRNYKHNNYLTYIFSSRDFTDVARKITALREVASLRERKLRDIEALTAEVRTEKETLDRRKRSLDSVTRSLSAQREKLQRDARNAKASIRSMSQKEKTALQRKIAQEQQLDVAIGELRKLTKGNTEGASFSAKTSGLRLPVTAGARETLQGEHGRDHRSEGSARHLDLRRQGRRREAQPHHQQIRRLRRSRRIHNLLCQHGDDLRREGPESGKKRTDRNHRLGGQRDDDGNRIQTRLRHLPAQPRTEDAGGGVFPKIKPPFHAVPCGGRHAVRPGTDNDITTTKKMAVRYFTDDCTYRLPQKRLTARWLHEVAAGEGYALGDVTYIFCSAQRCWR